ncbi:MAG TPA: S8 family peptidase [Acidimicrobiales bacterium]|nr:S8 family peptidase [Acidimicrobiales bacterium]
MTHKFLSRSSERTGSRWLTSSASGVLAATLGLLGATLPSGGGASADTNQLVIVTSTGTTSPASAVLQVGGTIVTQYTIINGVEASVPSLEEPVLAAMPGIIVTPDVTVSVQSTTVSTGPHTPSDAFLGQTGATQLAQQGDTGQGVTVAVLDTGIENLPDFSGRLRGGVDLSGENNPYQDSYGHGTFVAGLIAGNGASSGGQYSGEAPGAGLVSVKVAGSSGSTRLGTIISGLQWTVNKASTYGIGVLNISLGFQPSQSTVNNPLDMAVEKVWNSGIAVVASAGNAGPFNGTILSPGDDPLVITVGSLDDLAQAVVSNDEMNDFSSAGPTSPDGWVKPDLVASGRSVVSLAAPGSTIYNNNPSARIGSGNFVGSGTSFSAAITSGAAALVLAQRHGLTPNQVKGVLLANTAQGPVGNPFVDGHGDLNAYAAVTSSTITLNQSTAGLVATQNGTTVSLSPTGTADTWNPSLWSGSEWNGSEWNGAAWNGSEWNGSEWNGFTFNGAAWNGSEWNGAAWNGSEWNGAAWNGAAWNGSEWNGSSWS